MMKTTSLLFLALTALTTYATTDQDDFPYSQSVGSLSIKQDLTILSEDTATRLGKYATDENGVGCSIEVSDKLKSNRILKAGKILSLGKIEDSSEEFGYIVWSVTNVDGIESVYCQLPEGQHRIPTLSDFVDVDSEKVQLEIK